MYMYMCSKSKVLYLFLALNKKKFSIYKILLCKETLLHILMNEVFVTVFCF